MNFNIAEYAFSFGWDSIEVRSVALDTELFPFFFFKFGLTTLKFYFCIKKTGRLNKKINISLLIMT